VTEYGHLDTVDAAAEENALVDAEYDNGSYQAARSTSVMFTFAN
jgi:hypothetical protein